jgi:hypothetical protein
VRGPILAVRGLPLALIAPATFAATFTTSVAGAAVYTALALVSPGPVTPDWWLGLASAATSAPGSSLTCPRRHSDSCSALSPSEPSTQPRL